MKRTFSVLGLLFALFACSDYDEQEFTVLLPNAGADQVIFTETDGTTIRLNGTASTDVNNIGFGYEWKIINELADFPITISEPNSADPTFQVDPNASGRYELSLEISRGDQVARDFVNIDVNPAIAQVLLVNAIDASPPATLNIPAIGVSGNPVASKNTDDSYYNIDTNIAAEADGTILMEVEYNGAVVRTNQTLEALKNYTLYLIGTENDPEILFIEKTKNQNTIGIGLVGLDAINLTEGTNNVILFIDATTAGFGILPVDSLFGGLGVPEQFGILDYRDNSEIFFPSNTLIPLPIWATANDIRISNDAAITLTPNVDGNFGTFMLFPDTSAPEGHLLKFINNSDLLPQ
ncbi:MAG: hypothetical protein WBG90_03015 [Saonia sp.]